MLQLRQLFAAAALIAAPALVSAQVGESVHQHMEQGTRVIGGRTVVVPQNGTIVNGRVVVPQNGGVWPNGSVGSVLNGSVLNGTVINGAQQCWQQRDVLGRIQTVCNNTNVNQDLILRARAQREREAQIRLERERELEIQAARDRELQIQAARDREAARHLDRDRRSNDRNKNWDDRFRGDRR